VGTERSYKQVKKELRKELGLSSKDKKINFHHIIERRDKKEGRVPDDFPINNRQNITPLFIQSHEQLHFLMTIISIMILQTRVYLANYGF
jgi:hypothetical protein